MVSRTVVDSVTEVGERVGEWEALEAALEELRRDHPGAVFARYLAHVPRIDRSAFIAPGAAIVGDVRLGPRTSVWFQCVLRADVQRIEIGARSNLQDGTVVHLGDRDPTIVGEDVVVGHRAVLHGCTVGDRTLVGIGATVLDGVRVGHGCVIGAGALVPAGREIPPRSLVLGAPAKVVRTLTEADEHTHGQLAAKYTRLAHNYRVG